MYLDRNQKEIKIGDIVKHRKTIGHDSIFVVVLRSYNDKVDEVGLHRQGFYEDYARGCWDYEPIEEGGDFESIKKVWESNGKNYYNTFDEYLDLYCIEVVGNIELDKDKFELDPKYYKVEA